MIISINADRNIAKITWREYFIKLERDILHA